MNRARRRPFSFASIFARPAVVCFALGAAACAHGTSLGGGAAAGGAVVPPPRDVQPAELLARLPDDAEIVVRTSSLRGHPLAPRIEPFLLAWPGWSKTLRRLSAHPLAELEWIDVVGPRDTTKERLAARTAIADPALDARLAASGDGTLRVTTRAQPHLVTSTPPDAAPGVAEVLRSTHVVDPAGADDEAVRALLPHPHAYLRAVPEEAQSALLRVQAKPTGGVRAELELSCANLAAANQVAANLREQAERANGILVRMLTHDVLSGLTVEVDGNTAKLTLPASREQLEALATLAGGALPPD